MILALYLPPVMNMTTCYYKVYVDINATTSKEIKDRLEQRKLSLIAKYLDVTLNSFTCERKSVSCRYRIIILDISRESALNEGYIELIVDHLKRNCTGKI